MTSAQQLHDFGEYLRERRKELNKSANQVAAEASITSAYVYMLEGAKTPKSGKATRPSLEKLRGLARALDVPLAELAERAGYSLSELLPARARASHLVALPPLQQPAPAFDDGVLIPPVRLIGRDTELQWVLERLRRNVPPRVTALKGMGGIGKSALAAVIFQRVRELNLFLDGNVVMNCQDETDPIEVLKSILSRFTPDQEEPGEMNDAALRQVTRSLLLGRSVFVILDDLPYDLDIERVAKPLLQAGVALLLCARHPLPPTIVSREATCVLNALPAEHALELFAYSYGRAGAADLRPEERESAAAIVELLHAHTLAVKLAAAHAADTGRDLKALAHDLRAGPRRTLNLPDDVAPEVQALFSSSLDALPNEAQRLFVALAAFETEEFGRRAAQSLAGALDIEAGQENASVNLLVRRAMLSTARNYELPEDSDRERLVLHPLLQALAEQEFTTWPLAQQDAARRAIADFYITYIGTVEDRALVPDDDNVGQAIRWAHRCGDLQRVAALCAGMSRYWHERELNDEMLEFLPWGVEAAEALLNTPGEPSESALDATGTDATGTDATGTDATGTDAQADRLKGTSDLFWMVLNHGTALGDNRETEAARGEYQRSLTLAREAGLRDLEAIALARLAQFAFEHGRIADAEADFQRALDIHRAIGDHGREAMALLGLARVALLRGQVAQAQEWCEEALRLAEDAADDRGVGRARTLLGQVLLHRGSLDVAETTLLAALAQHQQRQSDRDEATTQFLLGDVAMARLRLDDAEQYYQRAIERAEAGSHRREQGMIHARRGMLAFQRHEIGEAEGAYRQALKLAEEAGDDQTLGMALAYWGELSLHTRRADLAQQRLQRALELHRQIGDHAGQAWDLAQLGAVALARGALAQAEASLTEARAIPGAMDDVQVAQLIQQQVAKLAEARRQAKNQSENP